MLRLTAQAPRRFRPLSSNVRRPMQLLRSSSPLLLALAMHAPCIASLPVAGGTAPPTWCPPDGPHIESNRPTTLSEGQYPFFKPGWAVISMRVRPGAVPVTDVRVLSESGSDSLARTWLPLVRQWVGCASNERDTVYRIKFTFGIEGIPTFPTKEAFSLQAFRQPRGRPELPVGDWGVGICPIKATLVLNQPNSLNDVVEIEGTPHEAVRTWLARLVPDLEYMTPKPEGNRVEFECRVTEGRVVFSIQ